MLPFRDISYAQGAYNMDADPNQIIAMKASGFYTGSKLPYLDDQLVRNYADATRLGKVPILYHFAGGSDPGTEAAYFIAAVHPLAEGDVYALDWEIEHPDPVGWCQTFLTKVHDATGVWPLIYMDIDRCNRFDWTPVFQNCGLWIAAPSYGFNDAVPISHVYVAQQGPIVDGVDTDMWFGTLDELKKYGYHLPPNPVAVPVVPSPPAPVPPVIITTTPAPSTASTVSTTVPDVAGNPSPLTGHEQPVKKDSPMPKLSKYNKFFVAAVGMIITYLTIHYGSNHIVQDAIMVVTALGVYSTPNTP